MVHVYTEDEKEGLTIIKKLFQLYVLDNIDIDSFGGIFKLIEHVESNCSNSSDLYIYVFDNIPGNSDIPIIISNTYRLIRAMNKSNIYLLDIICCEYEILINDKIEMFVSKNYLEYIYNIKFYNRNDNLTKLTKNNPIFDDLYNKVRNSVIKHLRARKIDVTLNNIEVRTTFERLCKLIFKESLNNDLAIHYDFGRCWIEDCPIKRSCDNNRQCNVSTTCEYLNSIEKLAILFQYSIFYKLAKHIATICGLQIKEEIPIDDNKTKLRKSVIELLKLFEILNNVQILEANDIRKQLNNI